MRASVGSAGDGLPKKAADDDPREAVLERLRQICSAEPKLRGVCIKDGARDEKAKHLVLSGFLDNSGQAKLLAKIAQPHFKLPTWKKFYANGIHAAGMKIVPLRSTYLQRIKDDFVVFDWSDKKKESILAQSRLDDLYLHYDRGEMKIRVEGVCIAVQPDDKDGKLRREAIKEAISALLTITYKENEVRTFDVDASDVRLLDPLPEIQTLFAKNLKLPVLFAAGAYDAKGTLRLEGWRGEKIELDGLFKKHFASHPCVVGQKTAFSLEGMKQIEWPIQKKQWNEILNREENHRKTHFQEVYFAFSSPHRLKLLCDGFFDNSAEKSYRDSLIERLVLQVKADLKPWPEMLAALGSNVDLANFQNYHGLRETLQSDVIRKLGLKQSLIEDVYFDAEGNLVVVGASAKEEQDKLTEYLMTKTWPFGPKTVCVTRLRVENWAAKLSEIQAKMAQAVKTASESSDAKEEDREIADVLRQTRLDELSFGYSTEGKLDLKYAGLSFHPKRSEVDEKLFEWFVGETNRTWPHWKDLKLIASNISIKNIKPELVAPHLTLQKLIPSNPALDGVCLRDSSFDKDGKLALGGFWRGPPQEKELLDLIAATYKSRAARPDEKGVSLEQLVVLPTDKLLAKLRAYVVDSDHLEEVRINRVHFDENRRLTIDIDPQGADPKANVTEINEEVNEFLRTLPQGKGIELAEPKILIASTALVAFGEPAPEKSPSLVAHLRETVVSSTDPFWDGVLIERAFFGPDGVYHLVGLVDNVGQRAALTKELGKLAALPRYRSFLKDKWVLDGLKVSPLRPMKEALETISPEYSEFDYLRLDRAYHTYAKKVEERKTDGKPPRKITKVEHRLNFTAFSPKSTEDLGGRLKKVEATLFQLLGDHPVWSERIGVDVTITIDQIKDRGAGRLALSLAHATLIDNMPSSFTSLENSQGTPTWGYIGCNPVLIMPAPTPRKVSKTVDPPPLPKIVLKNVKRYLDVALLHTPDNTTAWFLRAATHLASGDRRSAVRDLRRMNRLELIDPAATEHRLAALELFQGELRQITTELAVDERINAARGLRTRRLADVTLRD